MWLSCCDLLSAEPAATVRPFVNIPSPNIDAEKSRNIESEQIVGTKLNGYAYILTSEGYPAVYHKDYAH
jgi:hypothetical protein